jgi:hypothetical protein
MPAPSVARDTTWQTRPTSSPRNSRARASPRRRTLAPNTCILRCSGPATFSFAARPLAFRRAGSERTGHCRSVAAQRAARPAHAVPVGRGMCPRAAAAQRRSTRRDSHPLPGTPSAIQPPPPTRGLRRMKAVRNTGPSRSTMSGQGSRRGELLQQSRGLVTTAPTEFHDVPATDLPVRLPECPHQRCALQLLEHPAHSMRHSLRR